MYQFDEDTFLATLCKSKEVYFTVKELGLKPWFFRNPQNREIWAKLNDLVERATYDTYKAHFVALRGNISKNFEFLMRIDVTEWVNDYKFDDYPFLNMIRFERDDRRKQALDSIMRNIEKRIVENKPYNDLLLEVNDLTDGTVRSEGRTAEQIADDIESEVEGEVFETGLRVFDKKVRIEAGMLWVIAGESSAGKTSWAVQALYNFLATKPFYKGIVYSLETNSTRLGKRLAKHICMRHSVEQEKSYEIIRGLKDRLVVVKNLRSVDEIIADIKHNIKKDDSIKVVMVDYLQIVSAKGFMEETPRVAYVTDQFHQITQETGVLFMLLCQLRKQEYAKKGEVQKRIAPTMQDLRGSGQIVNCGDIITINWQKEVRGEEPVKKMTIEIVKNKDGAQGAVETDFIGKYFTFNKAEE